MKERFSARQQSGRSSAADRLLAAAAPRASWLLLVAFVLAATAVHLAVNGYSFGGSSGRPASASSDHANVLPWVYWYQDPTLFPHDAAIQMRASYATVLWRLVAVIAGALPLEWTCFLLYLLALAATYAMLFLLARRGSGSALGGALTCLLFVVVRHGPAGDRKSVV